MLDKEMEEALNQQLNAEMYSAYLYLSMAAYFESKNLSGFANWMTVQFHEEQTHAMKFYRYINERGGRVRLKPIDGPPTDWESPLDAFEYTLKHEQKVTGLINDLVDLAIKKRDHATISFLEWFVDEQVEEEANASAIVEKLRMAGDGSGALFMLDRELAQRVFVDETQTKSE